ncbi:hypothetical protein IW261DRAFT_1418339 [Armillaria novae-zelandiae]|uniref:Uncharacterized protein n=1 Tax=Armillaria novae-zelandiae TaxID=153914 RepID=A0AA39UGA1_9AGAR|nr:hypothetical protein IW261DRAFT_1427439 [Armillaria novae-zelandiae]KAK0467462.1 hypothetical protein IW261DRAFT_1426561 [Armillaria novae-zelandiae]KAK0471646.1 hypothetical protein IW261DRAFT_1425074 [Armillaria novae-zelandiae]KAK0476373.1 hypothetical protein IW261DRAFT_1421683 [Armillaria novae-zelandiae]KAK0480382.1 hypothetical protein IW261DRAFT_1419576 [Armillaria novae-zelandiae]
MVLEDWKCRMFEHSPITVAGPCIAFGIFNVSESETIIVDVDYNRAMPVIHIAVPVTANSAPTPHPAAQIVATQVSLPELSPWPTDSLPLYTATVLHKGLPALMPCQPIFHCSKATTGLGFIWDLKHSLDELDMLSYPSLIISRTSTPYPLIVPYLNGVSPGLLRLVVNIAKLEFEDGRERASCLRRGSVWSEC